MALVLFLRSVDIGDGIGLSRAKADVSEFVRDLSLGFVILSLIWTWV